MFAPCCVASKGACVRVDRQLLGGEIGTANASSGSSPPRHDRQLVGWTVRRTALRRSPRHAVGRVPDPYRTTEGPNQGLFILVRNTGVGMEANHLPFLRDATKGDRGAPIARVARARTLSGRATEPHRRHRDPARALEGKRKRKRKLNQPHQQPDREGAIRRLAVRGNLDLMQDMRDTERPSECQAHFTALIVPRERSSAPAGLSAKGLAA